MPISLNKVNAEAYAKVAAALEQNGKAAVEHATGTGKSCIAWQLIADHPQASFIWLVYGAARLTLRREDVRRYNDGVLPENLIFCDCGVLAEASAEEWVRLASRKPDYLIFDCYHEVTAACWAKSAQRLLRLCPEAKLLGLTVPNSTDQLISSYCALSALVCAGRCRFLIRARSRFICPSCGQSIAA